MIRRRVPATTQEDVRLLQITRLPAYLIHFFADKNYGRFRLHLNKSINRSRRYQISSRYNFEFNFEFFTIFVPITDANE